MNEADVLTAAAGDLASHPGHQVSLQQENRLLRELKLGNGSITGYGYLLTLFVPMPGDVRTEDLATTLRILVERHEALRTSFTYGRSGLRQVVNEAPARIAVDEHLAPAKDDALAVLRAACRQPFPPDATMLLRPILLRQSPHAAVLVLITDHIATDEAGLQILRGELLEVLPRVAAGETVDPVPGERLQARQWAARQRAAVASREQELLDFWRATLGAVGPFPPHPLFHPQDGVERAPVRAHEAHWSAADIADVEMLAGRYGMTRFTVLLAITQIALTVATGEFDIVLHSATANRMAEDELCMVGWCAHGLPFRLVVGPAASLEATFLDARERIFAVLTHADLPLTRIVRALAPSAHGSARGLRPPRFYFGYYERQPVAANVPYALDETEVQGAALWAQPGLSIDVLADEDGAEFRLHYGADRMDVDAVRGIALAMREVLRKLASAPGTPVKDLVRSTAG